MPFSHYGRGIYGAAELGLLQRVFDRLCHERRLAKKDREQRDQLAAEVIHFFDDGITGEVDLIRALSKRQSAQSGSR